MPRFAAWLFSALLFIGPATAQDGATLTGRVLDADSGEPLPGVNVFLAHTTRGSSTDTDGIYRIEAVAPGSYEMVVSIVGYQDQDLQVEVQPSDRLLTRDVRLTPAVYELDDVEVTARPPRSWRRRFAEFEDLFLGTSPNAEDTEILNPYVLDFELSNLGNFLTAEASAPLEIENRALGYRVTFQLRQFEWDKKAKLLTYTGRPYFEEMTPENPEQAARWAEARAQTYLGSLRHLLWAMVQDRTSQEHFQVLEDFTRERTDIETDQYYVTNVIETKPIPLEDILFTRERPGEYGLSFDGYLRIIYAQHQHDWDYRRDWKPDEQVSWLKMSTMFATIYEDGYLFPHNALTVHGYMGEHRVADLLPREYTLPRTDAGTVSETLDAPGTPSPPSEPAPAAADLAYLGAYPFIEIAPEDAGVEAALQEARQSLTDERWDRAARQLDAVLDDHPDHRGARYLRALAAREQAKIFSMRYRPKAEELFEGLIAEDSTYRDVLYQYALLERYDEHFGRALDLAEAQVRLRPDLPHAWLGLHRLYRVYVMHTPEQAQAALKSRTPPLAAYFRAEAQRLAGQLIAAQNALHALLEHPALPAAAPLLSLAKIAYAQGDDEEGQQYVEDAIAAIDDARGAGVVFEDVKFILTPDEFDRYRALTEPDAYRAFFESVWTSRDPTPARPVNVRLAEHYRRLLAAERDFVYTGVRTWFTNPDKNELFDYPATYELNEVFNDKGLIYIRQGEPDDQLIALNAFDEPTSVDAAGAGAAIQPDDMDFSVVKFGLDDPYATLAVPQEARFDAPWAPNESWRYDTADGPLDFHFVVAGGGANWRLTPLLRNPAMIVGREEWGGEYAALAQALRRFREGAAKYEQDPDPTQASLLQRDIRTQQALAETIEATNTAAARTGLTTDQHTWDEAVEPLDVPFLAAAFQGDDGQTTLEVHYALPTGQIAQTAVPADGHLAVELGLALHDATWQPALDDAQTIEVPVPDDPEAALVNRLRLSVPPDSYHVAFHVRPLGTDLLAGYRFDKRLPDFTRPALAMSDLLLAFRLRPPTIPPVSHADLDLVVNPYRQFSVSEPIVVAYEIYHLTFGADDRTRYSLAYALRPLDDGGLLRRRDEVALSVETTQEGVRTASVEYGELDVSRVAPGRYELAVTVTDEVTGAAVTRSVPVMLTE